MRLTDVQRNAENQSEGMKIKAMRKPAPSRVLCALPVKSKAREVVVATVDWQYVGKHRGDAKRSLETRRSENLYSGITPESELKEVIARFGAVHSIFTCVCHCIFAIYIGARSACSGSSIISNLNSVICSRHVQVIEKVSDVEQYFAQPAAVDTKGLKTPKLMSVCFSIGLSEIRSTEKSYCSKLMLQW